MPSVMPAHNVTVTGTWSRTTHTITYYVDGEQYGEVESHDYGEAITIRAEPTREGYTFSHWNRELPPTMPNYNLVVSGYFTINSYHVAFVDRNGTVVS